MSESWVAVCVFAGSGSVETAFFGNEADANTMVRIVREIAQRTGRVVACEVRHESGDGG